MLVEKPIFEPLDRPIRLGVLISGGGTTLSNFVTEISAGRLNAEVALVVASRSGCAGIEWANNSGLQTEVCSRKHFSTTAEFSETIFDSLRRARVDLVALAGFLSLLHIPEDFRYRVMNIHPALVPSFCGHGFFGQRVHEAVLARGVKITGCTVHFADNEYDHGPIILQRTVTVRDDDTPSLLAQRVFAAECEAYPEAIRLFADGRLDIEQNRVRVMPESQS
jgi:formyltetrahydrofolate-dependent phosphoribosylglycinamide formyltransferase